MTNDQKADILFVGATLVACTALAFVVGIMVGSKKKKRMVVTAGGELVKEEVEE